MGGGGNGRVAACGAGDCGGGGVRWVVAVFLVCLSGPVFAFGLGEGEDSGDGSGCCIFVPKDKVAIANDLKKSFRMAETELLRNQRWAGTLCENHPCAEISETNAKDLLDDIIAEQKNYETSVISWWGLIFSGLSFVISVLGFWYTFRVDRRAKKQNA
jgi:hypothetical protein